MKTTVVTFPFDLFGSSGCGAGASLLADELREILADNRRETVATRARAYTEHVRIRDVPFETPKDYQTWRMAGRRIARGVLGRGDFLFWLGGNHLGALPVYDQLAGTGDDTLVVQFDAHLDIHHFADCSTELSHGNFLLHCVGPLPPLINIGHRELLLTPQYVNKHYRCAISAAEAALDSRPAQKALARAASRAKRIFIDLDCDVLDPAFFPAAPEAVPFGLDPRQLLRLLQALPIAKTAGVLVSEFNPGRDRDDRSLATLMWLIEFLLLRKYE